MYESFSWTSTSLNLMPQGHWQSFFRTETFFRFEITALHTCVGLMRITLFFTILLALLIMNSTFTYLYKRSPYHLHRHGFIIKNVPFLRSNHTISHRHNKIIKSAVVNPCKNETPIKLWWLNINENDSMSMEE